ncbi:MAG: cation transporter [Bowdeniella nasicola]|nr:cation transporter [Bowdeniella nasicola]
MTDFDRTVELKLRGMTCGKCVEHVSEELQALAAVDNVAVVLNTEGISTVTAYINTPVDDADLREAIDEAGDYEIVSIERDY